MVLAHLALNAIQKACLLILNPEYAPDAPAIPGHLTSGHEDYEDRFRSPSVTILTKFSARSPITASGAPKPCRTICLKKAYSFVFGSTLECLHFGAAMTRRQEVAAHRWCIETRPLPPRKMEIDTLIAHIRHPPSSLSYYRVVIRWPLNQVRLSS